MAYDTGYTFTPNGVPIPTFNRPTLMAGVGGDVQPMQPPRGGGGGAPTAPNNGINKEDFKKIGDKARQLFGGGGPGSQGQPPSITGLLGSIFPAYQSVIGAMTGGPMPSWAPQGSYIQNGRVYNDTLSGDGQMRDLGAVNQQPNDNNVMQSQMAVANQANPQARIGGPGTGINSFAQSQAPMPPPRPQGLGQPDVPMPPPRPEGIGMQSPSQNMPPMDQYPSTAGYGNGDTGFPNLYDMYKSAAPDPGANASAFNVGNPADQSQNFSLFDFFGGMGN